MKFPSMKKEDDIIVFKKITFYAYFNATFFNLCYPCLVSN